MRIDGMTQEQVDERNAKAAQEEANRGARAYLFETDWYVVRLIETGKEIPSEIVEKRATARLSISET